MQVLVSKEQLAAVHGAGDTLAWTLKGAGIGAAVGVFLSINPGQHGTLFQYDKMPLYIAGGTWLGALIGSVAGTLRDEAAEAVEAAAPAAPIEPEDFICI